MVSQELHCTISPIKGIQYAVKEGEGSAYWIRATFPAFRLSASMHPGWHGLFIFNLAKMNE